MNILYLKDDFNWDCTVYLSITGRENAKIKQAIDDFTELLNLKKERANKAVEGEVLCVVDMPEEIGNGFVKAMNHLQNETVYNALFVMSISYLEFSLIEICRFASIYLKINFYDYSTDIGLDKAKVYLKGTLGVDLTSKKEWSDFKFNAKVRNCIVHSSSNIIMDYSKSLEEQSNFIAFKGNKNIEITPTGFLFINTIEFIKSNLETETTFINDVFNNAKAALEKRGH